MTPEQAERLARFCVDQAAHVRRMDRMLEVLVWIGMVVVGLLTAIALSLLP